MAKHQNTPRVYRKSKLAGNFVADVGAIGMPERNFDEIAQQWPSLAFWSARSEARKS